MKGIVIKTNNEMSVQEFEEPLFESLGKTVGGYIEIVRPKHHRIFEGFCFACNEEGLILDLPLNRIGTTLYVYGPIVGNIVILKEGYTKDGIDFVPMTDMEIAEATEYLKELKGV